MWLADGLRNLVANLGTSRDKAAAAQYFLSVIDPQQLQAAYRSSWLAQQIVDIPPADMVREWRVWNADADDISKLEAAEAEFDLAAKVKQAVTLARLYGGAAIYIGANDRTPEKPLNVERARLEHLTVLSRYRLSTAKMQRDPRLPGYGKPAMYTMDGGVRVHPSRLAVFHGAELPDPDMTGDGWGDSVLQATLDAVKAHDSVAANILSLTYEAKVDVVKIPGMSDGLRQNGDAYERDMLARWQLAMTGKGINGALMIDAEEDYQQKTLTFGGLHELWDRFQVCVAGASDIPATRLFGRAPAGMNSTGEADTRNYYDTIKSMQTGMVQPALRNVDELLIRHALGTRPAEVFHDWRSLHQPTAKDRAEVADKITTAFERVHRMAGLVPDEALGRAVVNALTESGVAPGLEADVAEYYAATEVDETPDEGDEE